MAGRNHDSVINVQGGFFARKPRDEPLKTHSHKPGVLVGKDAVPTFNAQTLPPGSAPAERTFEPHSCSSARNPEDDSPLTSAYDTLGGATSSDLYYGLGKPIQGQTSAELAHNGYHHRKRPETGLVGVAGGVPATNQPVDERVQVNQRALEKGEGVLAGTRGDKTERAAEEIGDRDCQG